MSAQSDSKTRLWLVFAALLVIAAGLGSRSSALPLPALVSKFAGDTLWAVLVFLLLAIVWPRRPTLQLAALTLGIAFGVELSQLYQAPWIDSVRDTLPGRLVLGQGFLFSDLLCYTVGIGLAAISYQAINQRCLRDLPTILGAGICITVVVAVVASNLGQGAQLFGFVDRIPGRDKTGHFLLMGALSFFVVLVLVPRMKMRSGKACALVVFGLCVIVGLEEVSQAFISTRSFSVGDLICSLAGIVVFGACGLLLARST